MTDPTTYDMLSDGDIGTLVVFAVACLALAWCWLLAASNVALRSQRWQLRKDLEAALNDNRALHREVGRRRFETAVARGSVPTARQHLVLPEPAAVTADTLPAWLRDPCTAPARYPLDAAGIATLADETAEYRLDDLYRLLDDRIYRVPALTGRASGE